jgi:hypothetical protein
MDKNDTLLFFKKALVFLTISIVLFLIINIFYIRLVLPKTLVYGSEKSYYEYLDSLTEKNIKYAFFGDSHVGSVNPHYINDSFNFESGGENYIRTYFKLNKILNKDKSKLDFAIIQIDLNSFSSYTNKDSLFLADSLWYYHNIIPIDVIANVSTKPKLTLIMESYFPVIGHGQHFSYLISGSGEKFYHGWQKLPSGNFSELNKTEAAMADYSHFMSTDNNRIDPLITEYFQKVINISNENNITLIFVKYPIAKEYFDTVEMYDSISSEKYYKEIFNLINNSNSNYYFLDYQQLFFNNSDYFFDTQHLTDSGSEILSKQIATDLKNLAPLAGFEPAA